MEEAGNLWALLKIVPFAGDRRLIKSFVARNDLDDILSSAVVLYGPEVGSVLEANWKSRALAPLAPSLRPIRSWKAYLVSGLGPRMFHRYTALQLSMRWKLSSSALFRC